MNTKLRRPGVRGVRGDRVGEVAGRRAGRDLEPELERLRQRHRRDAVLERVRRVHRVVLDPHLTEAELGGEAVGAHQRREPGAEVDRGVAVGRQEVGVAPDRQRTRGDLLAAGVRADRVVVVRDLERAEAPLAGEDGRDVVLASALPTSQAVHVSHACCSSVRPVEPAPSSTRSRAPRAEDRSRTAHRSGIGTWHPLAPVAECDAGCRGVVGPVPRPLSMNAFGENGSTALRRRIGPHDCGRLHRVPRHVRPGVRPMAAPR